MRTLLLLLLSTSFLVAAPVPKKRTPPDDTLFPGMWEIVTDAPRGNKQFWEFSEDRFASHNGAPGRAPLSASKWGYKIDPSPSPKQIQIYMIDSTSGNYLGLYEITATELKIIYRQGSRPTSFEDTANGSVVMRFRRAE